MFLSEADQRRMLALLNDATRTTTVDGFAHVVMPGLHRLIGCDEIAYTEVDVSTGRTVSTYGYPTTPAQSPAAARVWATRAREHPMVQFAFARRRFAPARLSDLCSRGTLERLPYYQDFYRPRGVEFADYAGVTKIDGRVVCLALSRSTRDFDDDDHDLFTALARPLGGVRSLLQRSLDARSALAQLVDGSAAAVAPLTPAERRVADLVILGASNRETAAVLGISSKAVEQHLTRVYRKLGVRTRVQLVRCLPAH